MAAATAARCRLGRRLPEIDAGRLQVVVDRVFPFAQAREALAYLETGRAKGKVVVRLPG